MTPLPHASTRQAPSQPSPQVRLPSSHRSGGVMVWLPHLVHELVQPSSATSLPSSHSSTPSTTPLRTPLVQSDGTVVDVVVVVVTIVVEVSVAPVVVVTVGAVVVV